MVDDHHSGSVVEQSFIDSSAPTQSQDWSRLKSSHDTQVFTAAWLALQAAMMKGVLSGGVNSNTHTSNGEVLSGAVVLGAPDQGPYKPVSVWPTGSLVSPTLVESVEQAIAKRTTVVKQAETSAVDEQRQSVTIACPLVVDDQLCGAAAFDVVIGQDQSTHEIQQQLEWGAGWLEVNIHRNKFTATDRLVSVLELVATSLSHERFTGAATALVTEMATMMGCERVAIGFLRGRHVQLKALSHSATPSKKANLIRQIEAAMDEAVEQQSTVRFPEVEGGPIQVTRAHEQLAKAQGSGAICTIPLCEGDKMLGALVLERPETEAFDTETVELCEHASALIGPMLNTKRKDDRWIGSKVAASGYRLLQNLFGRRHVGLKLAALLVLGLIVFFSLATGEYLVTADARIEGTVQRSIAVPMSGYIVESSPRAGDIVKQGELLFTLDDRDLRLERLKWVGQKLKSSREYDEAQAEHNRARARVLSAQIEQADAEIALLDEQLARTRVTAPFDSFVVTGDLSQSLGAPVERGDVLFEVAPLDSYRVILEVEERDIGAVQVDQMGKLVLAGAPEEALPIRIQKITPLSTAEEGRNFFRVEASLEQDVTPLFRPGMEGIGKIEIEERKLWWIWTHKITHAVKMFVWSWWP